MKVYLRLLKATCALAMQPEVVGSPAASQRETSIEGTHSAFARSKFSDVGIAVV